AAGSSIVLSTISGNSAASGGGGIASESLGPAGELTIESSTISGNSVGSGGTGGGISSDATSLRILDSTISGNQAGDTGGGISNGAISGGGSLETINSTISGNQARLGGGIFSGPGLLLRLTTVSNNTATLRGGSLLGGGPAGTVQVDHSILANGTPQDVDGGGGPLTLTANYSLIETPGTTVVVGAHNLTGTDPLLGPLASNGGPTLTHLPLPGSPVLDAGDPAIPSPPATDQRGAARIVGPAIDLGSVEGGLAIVEVPTLSQAGLLVLCGLLLAAGARGLRTRRST
ncbi:MAG TPA: IPTL-CTERM sorting domain-containing protein, partial [Thermoanaerobaculia bacterium]|nr:IPTL-CTERM sorting domain-containing protein [Thermoanaerobaculia bacterium]